MNSGSSEGSLSHNRHYSSSSNEGSKGSSQLRGKPGPKLEDAINEKTKRHEPAAELAYRLHHTFGLDHYPYYLNRWATAEIDELEASLEQQLAQVRAQKQENLARARLMTSVLADLDCSELGDLRLDEVLAPALLRVVKFAKSSGGRVQSSSACALKAADVAAALATGELNVASGSGTLVALLDEIDSDGQLFGLDVLAPPFCDQLVARASRIGDTLSEIAAAKVAFSATSPNDSSSGIEFDDASVAARLLQNPLSIGALGCDWLNTLLMAIVLQPVTRAAYPNETVGGTPLDYRHSFLAGYSHPGAAMSRDRANSATALSSSSPLSSPSPPPSLATKSALIRHTDNSEVTLNVGLGIEGFGGGEVVFGHVRGEESAKITVKNSPARSDYLKDTDVVVKPSVGRGLIHLGRHSHEVRDSMLARKVCITFAVSFAFLYQTNL